jgi:hypothetical protein
VINSIKSVNQTLSVAETERSVLCTEDNIRMVLQEVGSWCEDWIGLAQDRKRWRALVSVVRNLRVP